ncbi:MAG: MraY family glycosyltransferase [Pyrinomonadaceae bacterium]
MTFALLIIGTFAVSWFGVGLFRRWGLRRSLLDVPNHRSSHDQPVPRGGGVVIVILTLAGYAAACWREPGLFSWGYLAGALLIAAISMVDDIKHVPFLIRLAVHTAAAVMLIADLGAFASVDLFGPQRSIALGAIGPPLTVLWLVWLVNAYNFMDGIDGIAGIQALAAAGMWVAVGVLFGSYGQTLMMAVLCASVIGFLVHNWHPAKIFMGDVGSAFLGFTFASTPILFSRQAADMRGSFWVLAAIVLWPFLFDSVFTLIRRALRGERVWTAHRSHLYQRLVISGMSHSSVAAIYGASASVLAAAGLAGFFFDTAALLAVAAAAVLFSGGMVAFAATRSES